MKVAQYLEKNDNVAWVSYPGLESHQSHKLAKKYLPRGFGGVLSFGVKGGQDAGSQVVDGFKLISHLAKYVLTYVPSHIMLILYQCRRLEDSCYSPLVHDTRAVDRPRKER